MVGLALVFYKPEDISLLYIFFLTLENIAVASIIGLGWF
jgi:hypothetical protein